jgi:hypothetical protein
MRHLYLIYIFFLFAILPSCQNKKDNNKHSINNDNIISEFQYKNGHIFLSGKINDTIPINIIFDTGSMYFISDSIKNILKNDTINLQVGNQSKKIMINLYKEQYIFEYFGNNTIILSWQYFESKAIRISYLNEFIEEIDSTANLEGYSKIKIEKVKNGLFIPITVYIQGKEITERVQIDTGDNGAVDFGAHIFSKYEINADNALSVTSKTMRGDNYKYFILSDSIKIGDFVTMNNQIGFSTSVKNKSLLGNEILGQFDLVLDLKDFYMYIKPIVQKN